MQTMFGYDEGDALPLKIGEDADKRFRTLLIKVRCGFVEHKNTRIAGKGRGKRDALLLAA